MTVIIINIIIVFIVVIFVWHSCSSMTMNFMDRFGHEWLSIAAELLVIERGTEYDFITFT